MPQRVSSEVAGRGGGRSRACAEDSGAGSGWQRQARTPTPAESRPPALPGGRSVAVGWHLLSAPACARPPLAAFSPFVLLHRLGRKQHWTRNCTQDRLSPFSAFKGKVDSFSVRQYPQPPEQGSSRGVPPGGREPQAGLRGCGRRPPRGAPPHPERGDLLRLGAGPGLRTAAWQGRVKNVFINNGASCAAKWMLK